MYISNKTIIILSIVTFFLFVTTGLLVFYNLNRSQLNNPQNTRSASEQTTTSPSGCVPDGIRVCDESIMVTYDSACIARYNGSTNFTIGACGSQPEAPQ